ncbi:prephenate dehydrogenase/arogenate dehydrogenase family protein [bacterium]|nr:prephenate dehydrogenase/arogenate dehydrogenase family protein [bacterium]
MNIGIISLGLIGGSILKSLAEFDFNIIAVTRNIKTIEQAKKYTQNVSDDYNTLAACDVVFVASPINKTLEVLDKLENIVKKDCIVLDCASVKEFVMKKSRPYKFIGSHPMAGTENSGFDASFKELFSGAKWVLTPTDNISQNDIDIVKNIIEKTHAQIVITNAKEHDMAVALISHMPLLLAQALFNCVSDNELALKLASSGFRDMTRLAMSNLEMASDMREYNASNIDISIEKLISSINFLKSTKDLKIYADIKNIRKNMYSKEGKNIL